MFHGIFGWCSMRSDLRTLILLALSIALSACAAPRYQSAYRYEAPPDAAGRACLEGCTHKMAECREQCAAKTQACLKTLEPLLDERYHAALERYGAELENYRQERLHYDLYLSLNGGYPWRYGPWPYALGTMPYYFPPVPPLKPDRNAQFEQLRHERCDVDCGCQSIYDACFLACGGKKIPEIQCISNCPP